MEATDMITIELSDLNSAPSIERMNYYIERGYKIYSVKVADRTYEITFIKEK